MNENWTYLYKFWNKIEWREVFLDPSFRTRVSSKQNKKSVRTETNRNKICFGFVSVCFVKPKQFRFVSVFRPISKQLKQTELFQNKPQQTKITLNFHKNTKICSLSNCFGWSSVCFGSIETSKLSVSVKKRNNRNKLFRNKPKQTEKNRKNPKFSKKIPKYAPCKSLTLLSTTMNMSRLLW